MSTPLLMENWADFASLCVGTDGALTAQWFQRPEGPGARGYQGWYSRSEDGGRSWRTPARLGHEFVALAPLSKGRVLAIWLESARVRDPNAAPRPKRAADGSRPARDPDAPYAPSMKLMARLLGPDGSSLGEWTVDPDVCTCCQNTVATLPGDRVFAGYRGHTPEDIRDNKYAIFDLASESWTAPSALKNDGWKIAGCPVNGPAVDVRGDSLAIAWFTSPEGKSAVQARYSADAGRSLQPPVRLDLGRPLGRIETVILQDASALFIWMEMGDTANAAGIYGRRLFADGKLTAPHLMAESTQARASGFPRAALRPDGRVLVSWTRAGDFNQVQIAEIDPTALLGASASKVSYFGIGPTVLEMCVTPLHGQ